MPKRDLPMNPAGALLAVRPVRIMTGDTAAVVVLKASGLFIMQFVRVAELKPKFPSSRSRIGKFYVGTVSDRRIIIGKKILIYIFISIDKGTPRLIPWRFFVAIFYLLFND
jgi:hypothetical protein